MTIAYNDTMNTAMKGMNAAQAWMQPFAVWSEFALKATDMLWASSQTITQRGMRMAQSGTPPSARDTKEFARMGLEKAQAAGESWLTLFSPSAMNAGVQVAQAMWGQFWRNVNTMNGINYVPGAANPTQAMRQMAQAGKAVSDGMETAAATSAHVGRSAVRALQPVRAKAKSNARRLSGAKAVKKTARGRRR